MSKTLRYLRIAFSATCLIACGLLCALWVRSHLTADRLHGRFWNQRSFVLASKEGCIAAIAFRWHGTANWWRWETISYPVDDELSFPVGPMQQYVNSWGFGWLNRPLYMVMRMTQTLPNGTKVSVFGAATATLNGAGPIVPYWLLILLTGTCAGVPWLRRFQRFSLRTLLIATTLIAVVLGAVAYAVR